MMKNKSKIARAKVYSDFLVGTAIAWFSGGIITPFFTKTFGVPDLILASISIFVAFVSLRIAVEYKKEINING